MREIRQTEKTGGFTSGLPKDDGIIVEIDSMASGRTEIQQSIGKFIGRDTNGMDRTFSIRRRNIWQLAWVRVERSPGLVVDQDIPVSSIVNINILQPVLIDVSFMKQVRLFAACWQLK